MCGEVKPKIQLTGLIHTLANWYLKVPWDWNWRVAKQGQAEPNRAKWDQIGQKFWVPEHFGKKKFALKQFGVKKNVGYKTIFVKKIWVQRKFWSKKIWGTKNVGSKKFCPKKFWAHKSVRFNNNFCYTKTEILVQKFLVQQKF